MTHPKPEMVACKMCGDTKTIPDRVGGEITCPDCGYPNSPLAQHPKPAQEVEQGELKPCPFCGGQAEIQHSYHPDNHRYPRDFWHVRVECTRCGIVRPDWEEYGNQEQTVPNFHVKQKAEQEAAAAWNARLVSSREAEPIVSCAARKQGTAGGNDPADCDWPFCGCDPYADKVIAAVEESGGLAREAELERRLAIADEALDGARSYLQDALDGHALFDGERLSEDMVQEDLGRLDEALAQIRNGGGG